MGKLVFLGYKKQPVTSPHYPNELMVLQVGEFHMLCCDIC